MECMKCKKTFEIEDLDLHNGSWLCRICEDETKETKETTKE